MICIRNVKLILPFFTCIFWKYYWTFGWSINWYCISHFSIRWL